MKNEGIMKLITRQKQRFGQIVDKQSKHTWATLGYLHNLETFAYGTS